LQDERSTGNADGIHVSRSKGPLIASRSHDHCEGATTSRLLASTLGGIESVETAKGLDHQGLMRKIFFMRTEFLDGNQDAN
jgi:hypothetical protein